MVDIDALFLARLQFAFTVGFHIVFPAFSIGLASYLAVLEGLWLAPAGRSIIDLFQYWIKIFAIAFAMGVVSGLVMSYQFGTNWSVFSDKAGPVLGPLMAYEVLTAFFLEAGFLGRDAVRHAQGRAAAALRRDLHRGGRHAVLGLLDPVGQLLDADAGRLRASTPTASFVPADWWAIVFNPSFPFRLAAHGPGRLSHASRSVVGAVGAWHLLRDRANRGRADDVLDGDVDGGAGGAGADRDRRPARPQHPGAPAGQGRRHGGHFESQRGRRAADPVRTARPWRPSAPTTRSRSRSSAA